MQQEATAVIGGGIIGVACAWRLAQDGHQVVLVDDGQPGATDYSAGILLPTELNRLQGPGGQLNLLAMEHWDAWAEATGERSLLQHGLLQLSDHRDDPAAVRAWARSLSQQGIEAELLESGQAQLRYPLYADVTQSSYSAWLPGVRSVDPRAHLQTLRAQLLQLGVSFLQVRVERLVIEHNQLTGLQWADGQYLPVQQAVLACGAGPYAFLPPGDRPRLVPASGHRALLDPGPGWSELPVLEAETILEAKDTTLVPRRDGTVWAGVTFRPGSSDTRLRLGDTATILAGALQAVPMLADAQILELGVGVRPLSADGLPYVGACRTAGVYLATGHGRDGILQAPLTAEIISQLLRSGRHPRWAAATAPRGRCA